MNRLASYVKRTESWDEYPNGRWGDSRSPAFGELTDFHLGVASAFTFESKVNIWGEKLDGVQDIGKVFVNYIEGKIPELPWNDRPLHLESGKIRSWLVSLNSRELFTINSQPAVNCASSTDPVHGWGAPDGWVYQKAYLEFFIGPTQLTRLLEEIKRYRPLSFHAVNFKGDKIYTNTSGTTALTWGVFPNSEIKQPTVVDNQSFKAWKDEAFALWGVWARQYPEGSSSRLLITDVQSSWFLVNIVDNDFVTPAASSALTSLFNNFLADN